MSNEKKVQVSAVIVTYNRLALLKECIAALLQQTEKVAHIIVVDNHSAQETQDYLTSLGTKIDYLRLEQNIGGAGGFYSGIKYFAEKTQDDFVWVMDDDTIPAPDALKQLVATAKVVPEVGFLASNPKWIDGSPAVMNVPMVAHPNWTNRLDAHQQLIAIKQASFVSIMINRSAVLKVGLPIQQFFIWGDDTEYTERIKRQFEAYLVPNSIVVHKMKQNKNVDIIQDTPNRVGRYYYAYRNRLYNARQRSNKEVLRYWIQLVTMIVKVLVKPNSGKFKKIGVMLHGMWSGLWFKPQVEFIQGQESLKTSNGKLS